MLQSKPLREKGRRASISLIWRTTPVAPLFTGGAALGPAGENIGHGQAPDEVSGQRIAAMGYGIGLHEARRLDIPAAAANRDLVLEQRTRTSP